MGCVMCSMQGMIHLSYSSSTGKGTSLCNSGQSWQVYNKYSMHVLVICELITNPLSGKRLLECGTRLTNKTSPVHNLFCHYYSRLDSSRSPHHVYPEEIRHVSRNADSACPFLYFYIGAMAKKGTLSQHFVTHV